jgi:hypothetical protein
MRILGYRLLMAYRSKFYLFVILLLVLATACTGTTPTSLPTLTTEPSPIPSPTTAPVLTGSVSTLTPPAFQRTVDNWKDWPILPVVSDPAKAIYEKGLQLGTNPNRFAVFGDCQSMPNIFMARYDQDTELVAQLPANLQETIHQFSGSFQTSDPTIWPGTDFASELVSSWIDYERSTMTDSVRNDPRFNFGYCKENESPLDCVLRVRNPSIVVINLGTHYEVRNYGYLTDMLQKLIDHGVLPILSFKADNKEGDNRLNQEIAQAAIEFDLPVWNFYRAASALPDNGLKQSPDNHNIYLTDQGLELHRYSALQALDSVWRQLTGK